MVSMIHSDAQPTEISLENIVLNLFCSAKK